MSVATFDEYQDRTEDTAVYDKDKEPEYLGLGLASEAGEVAGEVKKAIRDDDGHLTPGRKVAIAKELGDVLWYVSQLATYINYDLGDIAQANLDKLALRKERNLISGEGSNR